MKKRIRFIDCGANAGQSIQWALDTIKDNGYKLKIDSFEANPDLIEEIQFKFSDLDKKTLSVHQAAVDIEEGTKTFFLQDWGAKTGSSLHENKESTIKKLVVWGKVYYQDEFGQYHELQFSENGKPAHPTMYQMMSNEGVLQILNQDRFTIDNREDLYNKIEVDSINLSKWFEENINPEKELVLLKLDIEGTEFPIVEEFINNGLYNKVDVLLVEWTPEGKIQMCGDILESPNHRASLIRKTEEVFKCVLDWKHPKQCSEPLLEYLKTIKDL